MNNWKCFIIIIILLFFESRESETVKESKFLYFIIFFSLAPAHLCFQHEIMFAFGCGTLEHSINIHLIVALITGLKSFELSANNNTAVMMFHSSTATAPCTSYSSWSHFRAKIYSPITSLSASTKTF